MTKFGKIFMFVVFVFVVGIAYIIFSSQSFTKQFGGSTTIDLEPGYKLVPYTVQWEAKSGNLWYLTQPAEPSYVYTEYEFRESSEMGILQGSVKFVEHSK